MEADSMERLPNSVSALILSKTTPRDVAVLSSVNKNFNAAASDDLVWKAFLPPNVKDFVKNVHGKPLSYNTLKELFFDLSAHHLLDDGSQGFWIDRKTGGLCRTFSAKTLQVTWMCTPMYWQWDQAKGSRFQEVARLKDVCWLEITGELNTELPPGVYTLAWVLRVDNENNYGMNEIVTFCTTDGSGGSEETRRFRIAPKDAEGASSSSESSDSWFSYNVRHITVEGESNDVANSLKPVSLSFSLREVKRGNWKRGLLVDGIVLRAGKYDLEENVEEKDGRDRENFARSGGRVRQRGTFINLPLSLRTRHRRF